MRSGPGIYLGACWVSLSTATMNKSPILYITSDRDRLIGLSADSHLPAPNLTARSDPLAPSTNPSCARDRKPLFGANSFLIKGRSDEQACCGREEQEPRLSPPPVEMKTRSFPSRAFQTSFRAPHFDLCRESGFPPLILFANDHRFLEYPPEGWARWSCSRCWGRYCFCWRCKLGEYEHRRRRVGVNGDGCVLTCFH